MEGNDVSFRWMTQHFFLLSSSLNEFRSLSSLIKHTMYYFQTVYTSHLPWKIVPSDQEILNKNVKARVVLWCVQENRRSIRRAFTMTPCAFTLTIGLSTNS